MVVLDRERETEGGGWMGRDGNGKQGSWRYGMYVRMYALCVVRM